MNSASRKRFHNVVAGPAEADDPNLCRVGQAVRYKMVYCALIESDTARSLVDIHRYRAIRSLKDHDSRCGKFLCCEGSRVYTVRAKLLRIEAVRLNHQRISAPWNITKGLVQTSRPVSS